jgi:hypothetical protein
MAREHSQWEDGNAAIRQAEIEMKWLTPPLEESFPKKSQSVAFTAPTAKCAIIEHSRRQMVANGSAPNW